MTSLLARFSRDWLRGVGGALAVVASVGLMMPTMVQSGDASGPAVSDQSWKFGVEGGAFGDEAAITGLGSYTMPLGYSFGLQLDGAIGYERGAVMGGGGAHLFARDPSRYLFGFYGGYHIWNDISIWRAATEVELYHDRFSVTGLAGIETVDVPDTSGGLTVLNSDSQHFFGEVDLSYYPTDDLKLTAGFHHLNQQNFGSLGVEYLMRKPGGSPVSLYANGTFGANDYRKMMAGIRAYIGSDFTKSLINRHRTEDPENHTPNFPTLVTTEPKPDSQPVDQNACGENGSTEKGCTCDDAEALYCNTESGGLYYCQENGTPEECLLEVVKGYCGDGIVDELTEQCDDGNLDDSDFCTSSCQVAQCGDGYVQQANGESCDDGNLDNSDFCTSSCQIAACGDGFVQQANGESCDDGNLDNSDLCTNSCQVAQCGDGIIQQANEEACDDGGTSNGDGCSSSCQIESITDD